MATKVSSLDAVEDLLGRGADFTAARATDHYRTTLALAIEYHGEQSDYVSQLKALGACDRKYTRAIPDEAASTTDRLRIRDSPDLAARILGYLDTGDHVHILEVTALSFTIDGIDSPWIRIVSGKVEGWVFGGYLSAIMRPWNLAIPELKRIAPITTRSSSRIACSNSSGVRQSFDQEDAP